MSYPKQLVKHAKYKYTLYIIIVYRPEHGREQNYHSRHQPSLSFYLLIHYTLLCCCIICIIGISLRLCTRSPCDINIAHLHNITNSNLLSDRRLTHLLNLMYHRRDTADYLDNRVLPTRQHVSITFKIPYTDKSTIQKSVIIRGAIAWNSLPNNIKEIRSNIDFKKYTKSLLTLDN